MDISTKKYELIKRDKLGKEFDSLFKQWLQQKNDDSLNEKMVELREEIRKKYCCNIYIPELTIQGVTDSWFISANPRISVEDARKDGTIIISKDRSIHSYSWEIDHIICCPPHMIPILIDPTTLTLNDEKRIKQEVWNIVKKEIKKFTNSGKWDPRAPEGEPEELARVLRLKDDTFRKYLYFYDLKIQGLPFRLIAFVLQKTSEDKRDRVFQNLLESKRAPRVRQPVRGESTIRHGFNLIFEAIYRRKAPRLENEIETQETYCCPTHNLNCTEDCSYLEDWMKRFNASCPSI